MDRHALRDLAVGDGDLDTCVARTRQIVRIDGAHAEDPSLRELAAQLERLPHGRDAEGRRAGIERGLRDVPPRRARSRRL